MKDLFIQFYTQGKYLIDGKIEEHLTPANQLVAINNGFSYISAVVNPVWVELKKATLPKLPDKAENIYVSVWYQSQFRVVLAWAKLNPECKFFVGGPITTLFRPEAPKGAVKASIPSNVEVISGRAESIIGKKINPKSWELRLPEVLEIPLYSYYFGDKCYWNKCTFCNKTFGEGGAVEIEPLHKAPPGIVFLSTPALRSNQFPLMHQLPMDNKKYWVMIRGDKESLGSLKKELPFKEPNKLMFALGVEFPSNRMLRFMNKGTTVETLLETINLLADHGHSLRLFYIVGWPNLIREDVDSAKHFFDSIIDATTNNSLHRYGMLIVYNPGAFPKHWEYTPYETRDFLMGHLPCLDEEIVNLNNEFIDALHDRFKLVGLRTVIKANRNTLICGLGTGKRLKYINPDYGRDVIFLSDSKGIENESTTN